MGPRLDGDVFPFFWGNEGNATFFQPATSTLWRILLIRWLKNLAIENPQKKSLHKKHRTSEEKPFLVSGQITPTRISLK